MNYDLQKHKDYLVKQLKSFYNSKIINLNKFLNNNISFVKNSRISIYNKNMRINMLITQYNNDINSLKIYYNQQLTIINNLQMPPNLTYIKKNTGLCIGINYINSQYELKGCINDANNVSSFLSKNGFQNIVLMTEDSSNNNFMPNKKNILNEFTKILKYSNSGDLIFISYSGHGSYQKDNNSDEITGYDQLILPRDLIPIVDDELKKIINDNLKDGVILIAIFDSCFSGSVLDLKYQYNDTLNKNEYSENLNQTETKGNVIMISGCTDLQTSADAMINNIYQGALTCAFLESYDRNITWRQLLMNMREILKSNGFSQIPQLSSSKFINIDTLIFL